MQDYLCFRLLYQSVKKFTRTKFRKHKMAMRASDVVVFSFFTGHKFRKFGKIVTEPAIEATVIVGNIYKYSLLSKNRPSKSCGKSSNS